jgi:hypothetical protein
MENTGGNGIPPSFQETAISDLVAGLTPVHGHCVTLSSGAFGSKCDAIYRLPDGRQIEKITRHGWITEYYVYSASEVSASASRVPFVLDKGWNEAA